MKPRITVVTLGVADLARARRFYCEGLAWKPAKGSNEHVTFIDLGGLVLSLWSRSELAKDASLPDVASTAFRGFSLAHNVSSKEEVDRVLAFAEKAGAKITTPAHDTFWGGYSGYFVDPDGFAWEVAWNPFWQLDADGHVHLER